MAQLIAQMPARTYASRAAYRAAVRRLPGLWRGRALRRAPPGNGGGGVSAPEIITVFRGIVSVNGDPFLRFDNSEAAANWLRSLGYRLREEAHTYSFVRLNAPTGA